MAEADRRRLLERALALPHASASDFALGRRPPADADPDLLRRISDTTLRTKLVETGLAEGLQSPKGPQKIVSIVRIYPDFDAPDRKTSGARPKSVTTHAAPQRAGLPTVDEMERLIARVRELQKSVAVELASETDARIAALKTAIGSLDGEELESAYHDLGEALSQKREIEAQARFEVFRRIESDASFAERTYLRLLRR